MPLNLIANKVRGLFLILSALDLLLHTCRSSGVQKLYSVSTKYDEIWRAVPNTDVLHTVSNLTMVKLELDLKIKNMDLQKWHDEVYDNKIISD